MSNPAREPEPELPEVRQLKLGITIVIAIGVLCLLIGLSLLIWH